MLFFYKYVRLFLQMEGTMKFTTSFLLALLISTGVLADEAPSKHLSHVQIEQRQDFKDNPPICYPSSNQNWTDEYKNDFDVKKRGLVWATLVGCQGLSQVLKKDYFATSGGITHHRDKTRPLIIPEWYPVQMQPAVTSPNYDQIRTFRCSFAKPDRNIPESEFTCTISCCRFDVSQSEPLPLKDITVDLPEFMGDGTAAIRLQIPIYARSFHPQFHGRLKYTAGEFCTLENAGTGGTYRPVAYFTNVTGFFTFEANGKMYKYNADGSRGPQLDWLNIPNNTLTLVSKALCKAL